MARPLRVLLALSLLGPLAGCYVLAGSEGGGEIGSRPADRRIAPADVALPGGYRIEAVASGLTFPTGIAFDEAGRVFVTEAGYSYGEVFTTPRLLRIEDGGRVSVRAVGGNGPWTGVTRLNGVFYVAEGGELEGGRILRIDDTGNITYVTANLPSLGDHHTNGPVAGADGWLYFGQGTATNSGVVGPDNAKMGWLKRAPSFHDVPCRDVTLAGRNFTSENPLAPGSGTVSTGAFLPFGTASTAGQVIRGQMPCSGAIMRVRPEGGVPELVAWGFRNPFGLAFAPDGRLYATDNQYDERGSRPVFGTGDLLWRVQPGAWHGWPDFHGNRPLSDSDRYAPPTGPAPGQVLASHPNVPPPPAAIVGVHASANGLDFARNPAFGYVGQAFVAQFGDQSPDTGKVLGPVGFKVVRVDVGTGVAEDFATNRGDRNGPASLLGGGGLERPVAVRFDPTGTALYIVDFGVMAVSERGPMPRQGTGVVWRVTRSGAPSS